MTKIVILGDLHAGSRNSNKVVEYWQDKFFNECLFPYMELNGIKRIIQLGDVYDNRKWLNMNTIAWFQEVFVQKTKHMNIVVDALIGNHDTFYKHTNTPNSPTLLLSHFDNFTIWDKPGNMIVDDVTFTMIPWMCKENYDECYSRVVEGGDICIGHFDIQGFVMHPGAISVDGLRTSDFEKWNTVWSGHYHTQSQNANIHYLGTPYQMNWSDHSTKHGFWVFDTIDRSMQFIENPYRYFYRFEWNDGCSWSDPELYNAYVKVNVKSKTDFEAFEKFIDKINFKDPFDLKVVESYEEFNQENVNDLIDLSSTEELIEEYIDEVASTANKDSVKQMMINIYHQALTAEDI